MLARVCQSGFAEGLFSFPGESRDSLAREQRPGDREKWISGRPCLYTAAMKIRPPFLVSFFLAGLLTLLTIVLQNYEFLIYAITVIVLAILIYRSNRYFEFEDVGLWLFNAWLAMHILGGLGSYRGVRIYDIMLLDLVGPPYQILKYDQFVHFFCYIAMAALMWTVVNRIADCNASRIVICVLTVLAASSIGAINEVIEFLAVVWLGATGVGDYTNTAIDLVANLVGAIVGTVYMHFSRLQQSSIR